MTRVKLLLRYSLLSLCLWLNICAALAQTNRALIVGISRYPEGSGWENIHASNDTRLTHSLLAACGWGAFAAAHRGEPGVFHGNVDIREVSLVLAGARVRLPPAGNAHRRPGAGHLG